MSKNQILFLIMLVLNTFAGFSFCHLLYLQFKQYRLGKAMWGGWTWRALTFVFAVSSLFHLWGYLSFVFSDGGLAEAPLPARVTWNLARPLMAPLLMQLFYTTECGRLSRHRLWQTLVGAAWAVTVPLALFWGLWVHGGQDHGDYRDWTGSAAFSSPMSDDDLMRAASDIALGIAVVAVAVLVWQSRRPDDSAFRRRRRHWYLALIVVEFTALSLEGIGWSPWVAALIHLLPLAFVLVTVYYGERLVFFDVFAKRGVLFFLALTVLTGEIALVLPLIALQRLVFVTSWITALTLLPIVLAAPWVYGKVSSWIDSVWLGRRFSAVIAATQFSESLHGATDESDLLKRAETSLSYIFQSKGCIQSDDAAAIEGALRASVRIEGVNCGLLCVLPRQNEVPFLSEDAELLAMLAQSFGSALESQRLRDRRNGQEQREKELVLSAARSELKALRAQINPHFLFNALNTIVAMIPSKPAKAEQTVEQLAEVFRYALRRSNREWVRVCDEISFVRSYLEIEQARFGDRLRVLIDVEEATEDSRIPAMVIQTLAENAIKHGITATRGPGLLKISVRVNGARILVMVEDNGPGFDQVQRVDSLPESFHGGYGLKNVQERLHAYFGAETRLQFARDATLTTVFFEVPMEASAVEYD